VGNSGGCNHFKSIINFKFNKIIVNLENYQLGRGMLGKLDGQQQQLR
jgi:hypothetical protein